METDFLNREFVSSNGNIRLTRFQLVTVVGVSNVESIDDAKMHEIVECIWSMFSNNINIDEEDFDSDDTIVIYWDIVKEIVHKKIGL